MIRPAGPGAYDAIVVGAGPNGLSAAITLARGGHSVLVVEARDSVGGGVHSAALTLPGVVHDVCSAVFPLGLASPFFRSLPLEGVRWIHSPAPLAHPLDDGTAAVLERSVEATAAGLGRDGDAYRRLMGPLADGAEALVNAVLGPLRPIVPSATLLRFGRDGLRSAAAVARGRFGGAQARALFAGLAAHSALPLEQAPSAAAGLVLGALGHAVGWPVPEGGAGRLAAALGAYLRSLGGEIITGWRIASLDELPPARALLLDLTPRQIVQIAGDRLPAGYRRRLEAYRYGPGVWKVDLALDGPIPWRTVECARAATVHVGGSLEEIAAGEAAVGRGECPERPFVLLAQPSAWDPTRAPAGTHTAWLYCHVPHGSAVEMTARIERQVERFAPGFRDRIVARHVMGPAELERWNANFVGGDIGAGVQDFGQLFRRPVSAWRPYWARVPGLYLCSASTPPGGGVHGMCGVYAARAAMRDRFR